MLSYKRCNIQFIIFRYIQWKENYQYFVPAMYQQQNIRKVLYKCTGGLWSHFNFSICRISSSFYLSWSHSTDVMKDVIINM